MDYDQLLHQINTSFCLLRWHVEALPDSCKKKKAFLIDEISHAQQLMRECSQGLKDQQFETQDVANICHKVCLSFEEANQTHQFNFPDHSEALLANTSNFYIKEIIRILLENAFKHTPENEIIVVSYQVHNDGPSILIENRGIGIADNDIEGSCRLGLRIAHLLAPQANCTIDYESDNQNFTRFKIAFHTPQ